MNRSSRVYRDSGSSFFSAWPKNSSERPSLYTSAVSKKVMPASSACCTNGSAWAALRMKGNMGASSASKWP